MYNRPRPGETEDDILKLQEEFLREKVQNTIKPAATVVKDIKDERTHQDIQQTPMVDSQEQLTNTFESIPTNISIGNVIENAAPSSCSTSSVTRFPKDGFPQAKRRDPSLSGSKGSIFAQQMKRLKKDKSQDVHAIRISQLEIIEDQPNTEQIQSMKVSTVERNFPRQSYIVTGNATEDIHKENVEILQQMTEGEILEEREKLLSTMDPAIVAFLKAKRKTATENRTTSIAEQNRAAENLKVMDVEASKEIILHPDADKWLNFDTVEMGKLAWMTEIDIPKYKKEQQYEARFDFDGWLLPFVDSEMNEKNRILYHHGDEPGRPGYTLQELFQLCRSSVNQQKIVALNSIANILSLYQSGVYDDIIELPFEQIFFVLRFCLDDNSPAILNSSIRAIRNLFYYVIDETCLDNLLGFGLGMIQPILAVDNTEVEDDNTINDQQLAETNLVKCLARTDILKRIRYIINTVKPSRETIIYCLEILIRLARDSNYIVEQIYATEDLLEGIIKSFLPKSFQDRHNFSMSSYDIPLIQAVKLCRVLASRSKTFALILINRYRIMDSIGVYLSNEAFSVNSNGLKLQIESLHLWCVFLHYSLATGYLKELEPIILRMLDFHAQNTDALNSTSYVLQGHVAALLNLLAEAFNQNALNITKFLPLLLNLATSKWITQFCFLEEFTCGKLQIITALLRCLLYHSKSKSDETVGVEGIMLNLLNSKGFLTVTNDICLGSNLLNNYVTHKSGPNFKTVEAATWNSADHIVPSMQTKSSIPFLNILAKFIANSHHIEMKLKLLKHPNIKRYLMSLNNASNYYLITNWFTRIESDFIVNLLRIAVSIQNSLDTSLYYEVAVKCLNVFNAEQKSDLKFILTQIVFSERFYPCEILISNLDITNQKQLLRTALDNLENISSVYSRILNITGENQPELLSVEANTGSVMPLDWVYSPIILLYSNQQQNKSLISEEEQIFIIINCLRWIYIYETYFPSLAKLINATDRFCRIACIFLGSDSLFLNPEIHELLENCLRNLLKSNKSDINFSKSIHGLNNFQDFYTQLLEQYQGVSYGDILFGNFILLPLMQTHDVKYRKLLWSEYAGIVQIFNVSSEQSMCPIELFLSPAEIDVSLLKCYRKALVTGGIRKHSVLYQIAQHHIEIYIKKKNENKIK